MSFAAYGVHVGEGAGVTCFRYPDRAPILSLSVPGAGHLDIAPTDLVAGLSTDQVRFAHELAEAASEFLAECERLAARQPDTDAAA